MAHCGDDRQPRVDEREHFLHGRVSINGAGDDEESNGMRMMSPLPFAQLKLMYGSRTVGATQTHADCSYTMLLTMKAVSATEKKSKRRHSPDVRLHIFNDESDPCKFVNITKRCSFAMELTDVMSADRGVQDGLVWEQSLEIDFRDAFPGCSVARTLSAQSHSHRQTLMAKFQDLQADEFRAAVQELAEEMVGDFPLSLAETAISLCYGIFAVLLCALLWVSRTKPTKMRLPHRDAHPIHSVCYLDERQSLSSPHGSTSGLSTSMSSTTTCAPRKSPIEDFSEQVEVKDARKRRAAEFYDEYRLISSVRRHPEATNTSSVARDLRLDRPTQVNAVEWKVKRELIDIW